MRGFQNLDLQVDALKIAGCKKIITDEVSGSVADKPGLTRLKEDLREGDIVVVWRLDRFGRSLKHLIEWVNELESLKAGFESLQESINTTSSLGLESARARGPLGGRPKQLDHNKRQLVTNMLDSLINRLYIRPLKGFVNK